MIEILVILALALCAAAFIWSALTVEDIDHYED